MNYLRRKTMETKITTVLLDEPTQELLLWHKPEVTRISVSLDTAAGAGSVTDGSDATVVP
jgi:hypothetical protein